MKKENKKLTSRQDLLDVWVSKGAVISNCNIVALESVGIGFVVGIIKTDLGEIKTNTTIFEILYSPESNFFSVMFDDGLDKEREEKNLPTYARDIRNKTFIRI